MPRVVIHAAFQTAPAHTAKVKELLHAAMKTSVAEPGCEYYVGVYPLSITSSFTHTLVYFFYLPYATGPVLFSSLVRLATRDLCASEPLRIIRPSLLPVYPHIHYSYTSYSHSRTGGS
jgi:hypothetical protein